MTPDATGVVGPVHFQVAVSGSFHTRVRRLPTLSWIFRHPAWLRRKRDLRFTIGSYLLVWLALLKLAVRPRLFQCPRRMRSRSSWFLSARQQRSASIARHFGWNAL